MKTLTALLILASVGCAVPRDTSKLEWYPHGYPNGSLVYKTTPKGHKRDAGPFASVAGGFATDDQIDAAVDAAFDNFAKIFPQFAAKVGNPPLGINDDYAMFIPLDGGVWVSGAEGTPTKDGRIMVCLWSRGIGTAEPSFKIYIARPPGVYWGFPYSEWRWTDNPLCPAIEHELLHIAIDDPAHNRPEWNLLNANARSK